MNAFRVVQALALALALGPGAAFAQTPALLPVQGLLTDSSGVPLEGTVSATFSLYTVETGGTAAHTETISLNVTGGLFTAFLGAQAGTPLALAIFDGDVWLGVAVGADAEMPRFRLGTAPFAALAHRAESADNALTVGGQAPADFAAAAHSHAFSSLTGIPAGLADGDDDTNTTYSAGTGINIAGAANAISIDQTTVQTYARAACYDTEAELTGLLNDNYAATAHTHPFSQITGPYPGDLTVNGDLIANRVAYTAPRTHTLAVPSVAFVPESDVPYVNGTGCVYAYLASGTGNMGAPVYLPDGARIVRMTAFFNDTSASDMTVLLRINNLSGCGVSNVGSVSSTGNTGYTNAAVALNHVVNNTAGAYFLDAFSTGWSSTLALKAVLITYTIAEAE